jgi:GGDEF domain-containing protein
MMLAPASLDNSTKRDNAIRHIGQVVARNLRGDDTVGRVGDHAIGIILVDINKATVPMVINRLRHMILSDPISTEEKGYATPAIRQSAVMIGESKPEDIFLTCMEMLEKKPTENMVLFHHT